MLKKQEIPDEYKKYLSLRPEEINPALLENLNSSKIDKQTYYYIFNTLYNRVIGFYEESKDEDLKEKYFDILVEILFASKFQLKIPSDFYIKLMTEIFRGKYYDSLLRYYKPYDFLNQHKTTIKILVSYIKPSFLFKSQILTPIHLGREVERESSKDGIIGEDDIKWLHDNCEGDNGFEGNISGLNRRVGFFTGTFWAQRNYEKLGNPKYFGSFGYRRLFLPNCLNDIENYDFILPLKTEFEKSVKSQLFKSHGQMLYDKTIETIKNVYPEEFKGIIDYYEGKTDYFSEIYIMKKELFFEFCEWIDRILNFMIKQYPDFIPNISGTLQKSEMRDYAYILERLTGYYLFKLTQNKKLRYKEAALFEPLHHLVDNYNKDALAKMRENIRKDLRREN